ncbi:ribonuclease Z [Flavobacterium sp.]|uniref:ribonuclease Z n=1 Tax=Flavobacterium sp. TaxID=239 RepID=UPI003751C61E
MKVEQKGHTTTIKDTQGDIQSFLEKVTNQHNSYKSQNLILDVSYDTNATLKDIKLFADLSKNHKKGKKSFIVVASAIDFNAVPTKLLVVPTLQEANDIIDMEEIERDLGF